MTWRFFIRGFLFAALSLSAVSYAPPRVAGRDIPEVPGDPAIPGQFIGPNEHRFHLYGPILKDRKGALISVGSLRTWFAFGQGDFDSVIRIDYDAAISGFNEANDRLILDSKDRFEYLARLITRQPPASDVEKARSGKLSLAALVDRLGSRASWDRAKPPSETDSVADRELAKAYGEPVSHLSHELASPRVRMVKELGEILKSAKATEASLFGSDAVFERTKRAIAEARTATLTASVSNEVTLPAVGEALSATTQTVSVVDLSNLMEHFPGDRLENTKQLAKNLRKLPLAPDAVVLFTVDARRQPLKSALNPNGNVDGLVYFSMPAEEFIRAAERGRLERWKYTDFLLSVAKRAPAAELGQGLITVTPSCPWNFSWLKPATWFRPR
jgi:hypothetical protein